MMLSPIMNDDAHHLEMITQSLQSIAEVLGDRKPEKVSAQSIIADRVETENMPLATKVLWIAAAAGAAIWTFIAFM